MPPAAVHRHARLVHEKLPLVARLKLNVRVAEHSEMINPACHMREVRPSPARQSAAVVSQLDDAALLLMAARTARAAEQILALARQRVGRLRRVRRLPRQPHIELGARHGYHLEPHIRVHHAAELRALPEKFAGLIRLKPHRIVVVRYHIHLARQLRHPEAVDNIHRIQAEAHRLAHRNE